MNDILEFNIFFYLHQSTDKYIYKKKKKKLKIINTFEAKKTIKCWQFFLVTRCSSSWLSMYTFSVQVEPSTINDLPLKFSIVQHLYHHHFHHRISILLIQNNQMPSSPPYLEMRKLFSSFVTYYVNDILYLKKVNK